MDCGENGSPQFLFYLEIVFLGKDIASSLVLNSELASIRWVAIQSYRFHLPSSNPPIPPTYSCWGNRCLHNFPKGICVICRCLIWALRDLLFDMQWSFSFSWLSISQTFAITGTLSVWEPVKEGNHFSILWLHWAIQTERSKLMD